MTLDRGIHFKHFESRCDLGADEWRNRVPHKDQVECVDKRHYLHEQLVTQLYQLDLVGRGYVEEPQYSKGWETERVHQLGKHVMRGIREADGDWHKKLKIHVMLVGPE
jgi:hypothetical protein